MNSRLFVGNLDFSATEEDLVGLFSKVGKVKSAQIITDKESGDSRGFGFVEMEKEDSAEKAIKNFHGKEYRGRELRIEKAKPREEETTDNSPTGENEAADYDIPEDLELR